MTKWQIIMAVFGALLLAGVALAFACLRQRRPWRVNLERARKLFHLRRAGCTLANAAPVQSAKTRRSPLPG